MRRRDAGVLLGCGTAAALGMLLGARGAESAKQGAVRWSTTMGSSTVDGVRFVDLRSTCGMFELLAVMGSAAAQARACPSGRVALTFARGAVTEARSVSGDAGGQCLAEHLRPVRFGSMSCAVEFSVAR